MKEYRILLALFSYIHASDKLLALYHGELESVAMNLTFRTLDEKRKCFRIFALVANLRCKYWKSNIFYRESDVKALTF